MLKTEHATMAVLTIVRYPWWAVPFGFISMALFRLPLYFNKSILFSRLMGSGKNGTFDKVPDLQQWAIMTVHAKSGLDGIISKTPNHQRFVKKAMGSFIANWIFALGIHQTSYLLEPIEGHGLWNGKKVFGELPKNTGYEGPIAIMTRATIRVNKLKRFWSHVGAAAEEMVKADGFIKSYGVGEIPWIKQATFSIWNTKAQMRQFAYKQKHHQEIIRKTHAENWYSEEMFVRFKVLSTLENKSHI